jgi:hypothetical protein
MPGRTGIALAGVLSGGVIGWNDRNTLTTLSSRLDALAIGDAANRTLYFHLCLFGIAHAKTIWTICPTHGD